LSRYLERILLVLILLLALGLRLYGLGFSLPYTSHPDEPNVVDRAVATIKTGDWNPHWFIYPSGYHYLQVGVLTLHLVWGIAQGIYTSPADLPYSSYVITAAPDSYLWARGTTALFGVLTVFLVYLLARRFAGPAAGLSGALLLALSPLHAEHSHYVTTDVPTAALTLLAVYLAVEVLEKGGLGRAFLAGLVVGLAGGFKYNGVVVLLPLLVVVGMRAVAGCRMQDAGSKKRSWEKHSTQRASLLLLLALAGVFVGYTLACPYTFADLPTFLEDLGYETHIYRFGGDTGVIRVYEVGNLRLPPWMAYAHALWEENPPVALAYIGGIVLALVRRRRAEMVVLVFVAGYYFFLSSYGSIFVRNILPAMPGLAVLGGIFLADGVHWLVERLQAAWGRFLNTGPDPSETERLPGPRKSGKRGVSVPLWFQRFATWGSGSHVLLALLLGAMTIGPGLGILGADRYMTIPTSQAQARAWLDGHVQPGEKVAGELHPVLFARAPYAFTSVDYLSNYPLAAFVNGGYTYVVANSETYGPEFARADTFPDYYLALLDQLEQVADFPGHTQKLPGPRLTIFRVPSGQLQPQHALEATAGPGLVVLGLDLGRRRGEGDLAFIQALDAVQAGQVLAMTLYLRAEVPLPEDYLVAVRLRDAVGDVVVTAETAPCAGACPMTAWTPGRVVPIALDLPLAPALPAGTYHLELQLLHPGTREAVPFVPAGPDAGVLVLAAIDVLER
jgi:hypothetical protein